MPKVKISEFSSTPANNTDIDSINISEGCAPSGINDAIRELMAQLKDFQTGAVGDSFNGPVGTTTAAAGAFTTLSASGAVTLSGGTANGVAYLNGSKVVTSGSALTFDGTNFVNTAGFLGTTQSGATSSYFIAKNSVATSGVVFGAHSSGAGYIDVINNNPLFFAVNDTEQMRLTSTGLGIGTSSPSVKLEVAGAAKLTGTNLAIVPSTATNAAYVIATNTGGNFFFGIDNNTGAAFGVGAYGRVLYSSAAYPMVFFTNDLPRMTLDSSGNLGLGVTPTSGWLSSRKVFQFGATGSVANNSGNTLLGDNYYTDSTPTNRYLTTAASTLYQQTSGTHVWYNAASGTAGNAITFTQAMTLDASGNLMVGTTTPSANSKLTLSGAGITIAGGRGSTYALNWADWSVYNSSSGNALVFDNGTERARIDSSGNLLVGTTSNLAVIPRVAIVASNFGLAINTTNGGSNEAVRFYNASTAVGTITTTGSATAYNTSSDQRLKQNIQNADSASTLIDSLQVRKFDWKADGSHQRYGFVAQELVTVVPEAVHQPEDSEEMMAVDYSKLVPMLVKEVQSLRKRLADAGL